MPALEMQVETSPELLQLASMRWENKFIDAPYPAINRIVQQENAEDWTVKAFQIGAGNHCYVLLERPLAAPDDGQASAVIPLPNVDGAHAATDAPRDEVVEPKPAA